MARLASDWQRFLRPLKGAPTDLSCYVIFLADLGAGTFDYLLARELSRTITLQILGGYTKQDPSQLTLPDMPPYDVRGCRYSLSRTTTAMSLIISTAGRRVGTDIEQVQTQEQAKQLIKVFHPADQERLVSARRRPKPRAITQAWTHKEALLKGLEVGLVRDPALDEIGPVKKPHAPEGWSLARLKLPKKRGHVASVAWEN